MNPILSGDPVLHTKKGFEGLWEVRSFARRFRAILVSKPYMTTLLLAGIAYRMIGRDTVTCHFSDTTDTISGDPVADSGFFKERHN
jgi:hypothetical protein